MEARRYGFAMACCAPKGCAEFFSEKVARSDARRYRKKGLTGPGRGMVAFLAGRVTDGTVLEVGGGVGALQLELLKAGAARATNVELSPAYEAEAGGLAREAGLEDRVERRLLDFAQSGPEVEPAEAVVLNKVVCCYPDYAALVGAAADRTSRYLVLSFPRAAWWTRAVFAGANLLMRARRSQFRAFVHPPEAMLAVAEDRGLGRVLEHRGAFWQVAALERGG